MAFRFPVRVERAVARGLLSLPPAVLRRIVGPPVRSPDGLTLDLQLQALVWLMGRFHVGALHEGGVDFARRAMDRSAPTLDFLPASDVAAYDRTVAGGAGPRGARVYTPESARDGAAPGLVFFHGGGWTIGSIASHDRVCRALASKAGVVVVSVDYRLAPEHPFPAAVEDALAATRAVLGDARAFGIDPDRVAVGGDSAGGNLSAVVAQWLRGDARRPAFQLLVYPGTDMTRSLPSHQLFREGLFLSRSATDWYLAQYLPDRSVERDPRASPLFAADLSRLPPALVMTAGFDPLKDEGRAYAEKMRAAGVAVEHVCSDGSMHGFLNLGGAIRESARMVDLAASRLRAGLAPRAVASAA
jgi:acetyl esterase